MKPASTISPWRGLRTFLAVLTAVYMVGCAGGSTTPVQQYTGNEPLPRPPVLLVYDFAVDAHDVVVDVFGPNFMHERPPPSEHLETGKAVAKELSEQLVTKLAERGITAKRATASSHVPLHALVVKGQLVSINEGDAMGRVTIGFGAGSEELRALVQVYQMTDNGLRRISEVEGEAHGRKTPGVAGPGAIAAGTGMVAGVVVSTGMNLLSEVKGPMAQNVNNLAEQFAERAVKAFKRQGWL